MPSYHPFYARRSSDKRVSHAQILDLSEEILAIGIDFFQELLPDGRIMGTDFVILNPHRPDRNYGSFRLSLRGPRAGAWADFALPNDQRARGGNVISWWAYINGLSQSAAHRDLKRTLASMLDDNGSERSVS
ncbi:MAG: hypothetical protein AAB263_12895 [Planctomycetota bacterium]